MDNIRGPPARDDHASLSTYHHHHTQPAHPSARSARSLSVVDDARSFPSPSSSCSSSGTKHNSSLYFRFQMSSRPGANTTRHRRPLSAIFIGNPAQLPDLPEPPGTDSSPGSSGLPSPPASNSPGSGSNGGDLSNESVRVPASLMKALDNVAGGASAKARSRSSSRSPSDDGDGADDEDHTARLSGGPQHSNSGNNRVSNESALQRVKSLTQRNRLVCMFPHCKLRFSQMMVLRSLANWLLSLLVPDLRLPLRRPRFVCHLHHPQPIRLHLLHV